MNSADKLFEQVMSDIGKMVCLTALIGQILSLGMMFLLMSLIDFQLMMKLYVQ